MPSWTKEQQEAIDKENTNIIVSAGAGSGKTAVLSERVIRKLKDGVNVNEMLILTFTNAAAFEMKERIRKKIKKEPTLKNQLDLIDGAYITTFDSFSLSIVKKYHYLLNIDKNVSIIDSTIIDEKRTEYLEEIMNKYYEESSPNFIKLINDFCIKDDENIKKYIRNISSKMDLIINKREYLDSYIDNYYNDNFINGKIDEYQRLIFNKIHIIVETAKDLLSLSENKFYDELLSIINKYESVETLNDAVNVLSLKLPTLPKNSDDEVKTLKEKLSSQIKDCLSYMPYTDFSTMKSDIEETKAYADSFINIIKELDERLDAYKKKNNSYEFIDIAKMAINIVKDNDEVRDYLTNYFKEIMIDEYQDTSDLQEAFISLIANDNVYMVGDIKQSIYRFRNANPLIFKTKYDNYSKGIDGYKIDLLKNFRSRSEVLNNINLLFDSIMDDEIGGARYKESHRMVYGNNNYTEAGKTEQNYDLEVLNYNLEKGYEYTKEEVEIFTIATDILNKVNSKYQIFDKDTNLLHDATYNDFCILIDRASKFDLYKKIFEYLGIPLTKYTSTDITQDNEIYLIKNILSMIISIINKKIDIYFKYSFVSIARSYLFRMSDEEIFNYFNNSNYEETEIYKTVLEIVNSIETKSLSKVIEEIIDKFNFYEKSITIGDIEKVNIRLEYIINLSKSYETNGGSIIEYRDYLDNLINSDTKMECSFEENISESVKIMTIHKSKGLEFPICYFSGFSNKFNIRDVSERFIFNEKYGIICPYFNEGIGDTIYKYLYKNDYLIDEISEKIRLLYVALTRAKEKLIIISSTENKSEIDDYDDVVDINIRSNYKSFKDILDSIYPKLNDYINEIDLNKINLTHDYNLIKKVNYIEQIDSTNEMIDKREIQIDNEEIEEEHFSKSTNEVYDKDTKEKMELGTYMHYLFELVDFKKKDLSYIDDKYKDYIESFISTGLDFNNCNIYKEFEFIYEEDNINKHGIIDLMLEYDDQIKIIDYKLKHVEDENYIKQLNGYKNYISSKSNKKISIYLYSIIDKKLIEIA